MSFRTKVLLVLTVVGVLPIALVGVLSYRANRDELVRTVGEMQAQSAQDLALSTEELVLHAAESLRMAVSNIPFDSLQGSEQAAVLRLPYQQLPWVNVVALVDGQGRALAPAVFDPWPALRRDSRQRDPVSEEDLALFSRKVPLQAAIESGLAVGPPYRARPTSAPRLAIAVRIAGGAPRVLAAELSLTPLVERLEKVRGDTAYLVDSAGEPFAFSQPLSLEDEERALVRSALSASEPQVRSAARAGGARFLVAAAPVKGLGWVAVVGQRAETAFRAAERVRTYSSFWAGVALLLTVVLGLLLARGVSRPVAALSRAVKVIAAGDQSQAVDVSGGDELADLGRAFNHMSAELQRRDAEIRTWNAELQKRVEDRTRELKEAQDQINRSRRLAALNSLSAGLAHELNNPLFAVVGIIGLAQEDLGTLSPTGQLLTVALDQANRMAKIVDEMRTLAEQERASAGIRFSLPVSVKSTLELYRDKLREKGIQLSTHFADPLPAMQGSPGEIERLVDHLLQNAINAMPEGGNLEVRVSGVEDEALKLVVKDTGKGIPANLRERIFDPFFTTKQGNSRIGLGLTVSHNIVTAHHGKISVESEEGRGSTFTVLLPAAGAGAHLS